jgi:hypothetical protein
MPPNSSSSSLLPGPHDPYNASSVKLAEATRVRPFMLMSARAAAVPAGYKSAELIPTTDVLQIRLVLPGLGSCDKDEGSSSAVQRSNTGDLSGKPGGSAAAPWNQAMSHVRFIGNCTLCIPTA